MPVRRTDLRWVPEQTHGKAPAGLHHHTLLQRFPSGPKPFSTAWGCEIVARRSRLGPSRKAQGGGRSVGDDASLVISNGLVAEGEPPVALILTGRPGREGSTVVPVSDDAAAERARARTGPHGFVGVAVPPGGGELRHGMAVFDPPGYRRTMLGWHRAVLASHSKGVTTRPPIWFRLADPHRRVRCPRLQAPRRFAARSARGVTIAASGDSHAREHGHGCAARPAHDAAAAPCGAHAPRRCGRLRARRLRRHAPGALLAPVPPPRRVRGSCRPSRAVPIRITNE